LNFNYIYNYLYSFLEIKLQNYLAAIDDCESCLKLEPENLKALLRLADANYSQGRRREVGSYIIFSLGFFVVLSMSYLRSPTTFINVY